MKFLVTGAAGLVGSQVVKDLVEQKQTVFSCFHDEKPTNGNLVYLDLSDENNIIKTLQEIKPDVIIHLAAITNVDLCETEQELATKINVNATKILAQQAAKCRLDGIVCSALDLKNIKDLMPKNFIYVTPGVRPHKTNDDQKRVMTPIEAFKAGSTILVIGRPITEANDPNQIINQIYSDFPAD